MIQNRAARLVTKRGWFTSQKILLKETNWLSIRQMIFYHTILQVWRVKKTRRPKYLNEMFNPEYGRQTRNITEGNIRIQEPKTSLGKKAIRFRGASMWNTLPANLKMFTGEVQSFKKQLKRWIRENIEMWRKSPLPPASEIIDYTLNDAVNKSIYLWIFVQRRNWLHHFEMNENQHCL